MHDRGDHEERGDVDEEEAAAEDAQVARLYERVREVRERPQQDEHPDEAGDVHRGTHTLSGFTAVFGTARRRMPSRTRA